MGNTLRQKFGIDAIDGDEGNIKVRAAVVLGSGALGAVIALGVAGGLKNIFPNFGGDFLSTTTTPEHTTINAKTIKIVPVRFDCIAMAAYDAGDKYGSDGQKTENGSEVAVKTHGFIQAAHANKAKAVATICATDVKVVQKPSLNVATNTVEQDVYVDVDSMVANAQISEPDTQIVDTSGGWTEMLSGGAQAADSFIDGVCKIVTIGNCDDGLANPADAAVKTSREDQAKTQQYLRVKILETVQNKCLAGDWAEFQKAIVEAYKQQGLAQGVSADAVRVHFVDDSGKDVVTTPDFSRKAIQALIDAGAITDTMPDVEVINEAKTEVNCTSLIPQVTSKDLQPSSLVASGAGS